jgi:hypothetical protein
MSSAYEVREKIDSSTLQAVRAIADSGAFEAYSLKYRHPRFKSRFSSPSFIAWFKLNGQRMSEVADSLDDLDQELQLYLTPCVCQSK